MIFFAGNHHLRQLTALFILLLITLTPFAASIDVSTTDPSIFNIKDLKNAMYTTLSPTGDACIRLLNADGAVGCAAPSASTISGKIFPVASSTAAHEIPQGSVVLVPAPDAGDFLVRTTQDTDLSDRLNGVLIQFDWNFSGWNEAGRAPYPQYAMPRTPQAAQYTWNPSGNDLVSKSFPFPVFQLDNVSSANAVLRANYNTENQYDGAASNIARMELTMQASGNSSYCIGQQLCYPLGGNSVWAMLPPLPPNISSSSSTLVELSKVKSNDSSMIPNGLGGVEPPKVILVTAQVDSTGLFHRLVEAADSPLSGLIAMMAAAQILGDPTNNDLIQSYQRRVAFLAVMGEPWDFMGSRRLLWEMENGAKSVNGLTLENIDGVIELGQIGKAVVDSNNKYQIYGHTMNSRPATIAALPLQAAFQAAAAVPASTATFSNASSSLHGLPPCTASSFLKQRENIPVLVLEEFDSEFINKEYHSQYDREESINSNAIASVAMLVAQSVHSLANSTTVGKELYINSTAVLQTVESLLDCLARPDPGLACPLVQALMTPAYPGPVPHYIGILRTVTEDSQTPDPNVQSDVERFLWNYLAVVTASSITSSTTSDENNPPPPRCRPNNATSACPLGTVCAGYREIQGYEGTGACINATVRFVPSYSTDIECAGCNGTSTFYEYRWNVTNAGKAWAERYGWPKDPIWTESNWPDSSPYLEMYLKESAGIEYAVLGAGLGLSAVAFMAAMGVRVAWNKRLKRD